MSEELTGKELAKNLLSAKRDAADVAKSSKIIKDSLAAAAQSLSKFSITKMGTAIAGGILGSQNVNPGGMPGQAEMQNSLYKPGVGLTDFTNFASGMAKGFTNFLPDVASTIQRAGNYYNATIMGGFRGAKRISRGDVENVTYGTLAEMGGVTSAGSSAMVANIFANQGMVAGSATYAKNVRAVGNAARYLNMSNETAAAAIGGLGTGAMSANLMRNFGVYTTDPNTGEERSMSDIFEDLASRFTKPGANASAEDVQNSIRKGALGAAIASSGLSNEQQTLFKQYMIERAGGNKMDLSDQNQMKKLMDAQNLPGILTGGNSGLMAMNDNPLNAMMDLETSQEGVEKQATPAYIAGVRAATISLKGLDAIAAQLGKTLGMVTAGMQTVLGARTTQGMLGMANSSLNLISSGLDALEEADPTKISMAIAGGAAVGTGAVGLGFAGQTAAWGNILGMLGASGKTGGGGDSSVTNPLGELSNSSYTLGGGEKVSIGQPLEGTLKVSGYNFHQDEGADHGHKIHTGIDYAATRKSKVFAVADGKVDSLYRTAENSWWVGGKHSRYYGQGTGNGNFVKIDHGIGKNKLKVYSIYKHLTSVASGLKEGSKVKKGDFLGYAGDTGDADGVHLHYEVMEGNTEVDPKYLGGKLGNTSGTKFGISSQQMGQASSLVSALQSLYGGDVNSAISQLTSVLGIDAMNSKYGLSSTSSPATSAGNAGTGSPGGGTGNNITNNVGGITVNIQDATPESAKKFADYVKEYLENQTLTSNLGSY